MKTWQELKIKIQSIKVFLENFYGIRVSDTELIIKNHMEALIFTFLNCHICKRMLLAYARKL